MIGISLLFLLCSCTHESDSLTSVPENLIITEAKHGFEIIYDERASQTVGEYMQSGTRVINGSYFGTTTSGYYYPAGYWEHPQSGCCVLTLGDGQSRSIVPDTTDPNLTHIVGVSTDDSIKIFPREFLKENAGPYKYAFQAGPLVLSGGLSVPISHSWHADEPHRRTLIGKTRFGRIYFFTIPSPLKLSQVGALVSEYFRDDPITLLNLDGGPSTAYFDGSIGYNQNARLPILIRIFVDN